jgi:hypothetical protein
MLCVASHWKATVHMYSLKKFQKIQKVFAFTTACPKSLNSIYGNHRPLGVKSYFKFVVLKYAFVATKQKFSHLELHRLKRNAQKLLIYRYGLSDMAHFLY